MAGEKCEGHTRLCTYDIFIPNLEKKYIAVKIKIFPNANIYFMHYSRYHGVS